MTRTHGPRTPLTNMTINKIASSVKPAGEFWLGKLAKYMV